MSDIANMRRCRTCPTILSRYNPGATCASCDDRRMRHEYESDQPKLLSSDNQGHKIAMTIARLRQRANLTRKEFGAIIDKSVDAIRACEEGVATPQMPTLYRIAVALGVRMEDLWTGCTHDIDPPLRSVSISDEEQVMRFGRSLYWIRARRSLSVLQLAHEAGVQASTLSRYEGGYLTPSVRVAHRLSAHFQMSLDQLWTGLP